MPPVSAGSSGKGKELKLVVVGSGGESSSLSVTTTSREKSEWCIAGQEADHTGVGKSAITIRFVTSQFYDR
jgi:hypothetical protein